MKTLKMAFAMLALSAGAALADPLEGMWRMAADDNGNSGLIQVAPCGAYLCGQLVRAYDASGAEIVTPNVGRLIISETISAGGANYTGKVYSPDRDATYNSRLTLSGDTLSVEGCFLGICRDGGTWTRQ